jgi:hypothetical protein
MWRVTEREGDGIIIASQIVMASLTHLLSISALFPGVSEYQRRIDTMSFIVVLALSLGALGFVVVLTLVQL